MNKGRNFLLSLKGVQKVPKEFHKEKFRLVLLSQEFVKIEENDFPLLLKDIIKETKAEIVYYDMKLTYKHMSI